MAVAAVVVISLAAPAAAQADNPLGAKVDDKLAALVEFAAPTDPVEIIMFGSDLAGANSRLGLTRTYSLPSLGAQSSRVRVEQLSLIAQDPGVTWLTADLPVGPTGQSGSSLVTPTASTLENLYPLVDGAPEVWARGIDGSGVGIAVIDSGAEPVDDFGTRLSVTTLSTQSYGAVKNDRVGHGSLVTSIAAGRSADGKFVGIAPGATVYAVNVQRADGIYSSDVLNGLEWVRKKNATKKNIRVVVLALSEIVATPYRSSMLDAMIDRLWADGVVVVVSAGNTGPDTAQFAPGNDPFAITVGATDTAGTADTADDSVAPFSTSGFTADGHAKPELLAPGRLIAGVLPATTELGLAAPLANIIAPGYARMSGTSFSAPQVAGAAALIAQAHKTWTPDMIKWVLMATARPVAGSSVGALDVNAAVGYPGTPGQANVGIEPSRYGLFWTTETFRAHSQGNSWTGNSWTGNSWTGNSWTGNAWNGNSWTGNSWTGNSWTAAGWE